MVLFIAEVTRRTIIWLILIIRLKIPQPADLFYALHKNRQKYYRSANVVECGVILPLYLYVLPSSGNKLLIFQRVLFYVGKAIPVSNYVHIYRSHI